jgi:hypothetical protein
LTLASAGEEISGAVIETDVVELRAEVGQQQMARYSYRVDGRNFHSVGTAIALARFSWWKGSRPAVFTFTRGNAGGMVDIDWFRVETPAPAP